MAKEHGARTVGMDEEVILWMVKLHTGIETIVESSTEAVCRQELGSYLDYVWRCATHQPEVSVEEWFWRLEHLWPQVVMCALWGPLAPQRRTQA